MQGCTQVACSVKAPDGISRQLADFAARVDAARLPAPVIEMARRCLLDTVGVALAGTATDSARRIAHLAASQYGAGPSQVLPGTSSLTPAGAALANGAAAHALDFDDNSYAGIVHGSATTFPAVLAVAQAQGSDGRTLLAGFVAGVEVQYALGLALTRTLYERGWWSTSVLGAIGAAAGAGRVLGLDVQRMETAIGLAAAGTGGVRAVRGSDAKHYLCGRAAEAGVAAALLAAAGAVGPADVFSDRNGLLRAFNDAVFEADAVRAIGQVWRLLDPGIDVKRQPTCYASHAACDALVALMAEHALTAADIDSLSCEVPPLVASNLTFPRPRSAAEAQFSLEFALAATALHGGVTLDQLQHGLDDPVLLALAARVTMCTNPALATPELAVRCPECARVSVQTVSGRQLQHFECVAQGTGSRPLSLATLEAKFTDCARRVTSDATAAHWLALLRDPAAIADVRLLFGDPAPSAGEPVRG